MAAVLAFDVAVCEWLDRHTPLRHLGTAMLVIVLAAIQANLGLIPTYGAGDFPVYSGAFGPVVDLSIFWLLLRVDLRRVLRAGSTMLFLFAVAALGTAAGVLAGMAVVDGAAAFGEHREAIGGMFTATYIGGSANLTTLAKVYEVHRNPVLFAGVNAVDAAMTTVWMLVCVAVPRLLDRTLPGRSGVASAGSAASAEADAGERESVTPADLALVFGAGLLALWASEAGAAWLEQVAGVAVPSIVVLTVLALVLAQTPLARRFQGARALGLFAVYIFLAAIGALCDLEAVTSLGGLALDLTLFVSVLFLVHGLVVFGAAALFKLDFAAAAVASQAGVGGGSSALALAKSLGRNDLVLPGILAGSLGTALGTFVGLAVARML